jgi:hypothetical protein
MSPFKKYFLVFILLSGTSGVVFRCAKQKEKPVTVNPAYTAKLIFKEDFSRDLRNWYVGGRGKTDITRNIDHNVLRMQLDAESTDLVLWSMRDFSDNFQIEYKIIYPDSCGSHIIIFCARGAGDEDLTQMPPPPPQEFRKILEDSLAGYQISCHTYDETCRHLPNSRVRKNPGNLLLESVGTDPCQDNGVYVIDVLKIDNRIQYYVDGVLIHDLQDRGGFGPVYMSGKVGFYIQGRAGSFNVILDNIRIFKLIPK